MENHRQHVRNPIASFNRFWKVAERIITTVAFVMVFGTVGFVSLHLLA